MLSMDGCGISFIPQNTLTHDALMYPEQVSARSGFLLLLFNRLVALVEQLACTFRRLAGDVLHRHRTSPEKRP